MCHFLGDFTRYSGHSLLTLVIYMKYSSPAFFPNQQLFKYFTVLKGHNQLLDGADLNTSFLTLKKKFTPTWNQSSSRNSLSFSQCFAWFSIVYWKTHIWVLFFHPMILLSPYLVKNSMDRISVVCKLALKGYLMRMCASWLCNDYCNPDLDPVPLC